MADFRYDNSGVRQLAVGAEMHVAIIDTLAEAKAFAISISPDARPYGAGYIDSFEIDGGNVERSHGMRRATGYLRNTSSHAVFVELGNGHGFTGHHVLARTADWIEGT